MLFLYNKFISNFIRSKDRINIKIDKKLINHLYKKSDLNLKEIKKFNNLLNKEYFSRKKLFKDLSFVYKNQEVDTIVELILDANTNLTGRPSSQNYPIY